MKSELRKPILSICIPTYNRAHLLDKLLNQIIHFEDTIKSKVEICISDNHSSDGTSKVIEGCSRELAIKSTRQNTNIGGSRNFQEVVRLSTAPWVLLMGDDDLFCAEGLAALLELLDSARPNTWILADIANQDGTSLLQKYSDGMLSKQGFKKKILLNSLLDSLGFMSMHVIPKSSIAKFTSVTIDKLYGWPHLALLFLELSNIEIYVHRKNIVKRGGDGEEITQTWQSNDWLCLMMQKTKLCCYSELGENIFSTSIAIREYTKWAYVRQIFHARLSLETKYGLMNQATKYIDATPIHSSVKLLLKIYVRMILIFPANIISKIRRFKNPNATELGRSDTERLSTDGIDRGL